MKSKNRKCYKIQKKMHYFDLHRSRSEVEVDKLFIRRAKFGKLLNPRAARCLENKVKTFFCGGGGEITVDVRM